MFAGVSPLPTATAEFFHSQKEHSRVKATIVAKYAQAWARIFTDFQRKVGLAVEVAYIDLFSGPGTYADGTPSTPLHILTAAVQDTKLQPALRTFFNDLDSENTDNLLFELYEFPGLERLTFPPQLSSEQASLELIKNLGIPSGTPRLFFLDQFGYKHVTLEMIRVLMSEKYTECIFFLNYARLIGALSNPAMSKTVVSLFGSDREVSRVCSEVEAAVDPLSREQIVLAHLVKAFKSAGARYVQPFSFRVEDTQRSTHHLIFLTTHDKGYALMKGIMAKEGTPPIDGVPSLSYVQKQTPQTGMLFASDPIDDLAQDLLFTYQGQTLSMHDIFLRHSPGTNFVPSNYRNALMRLEEQGYVVADPPANKRPINKGSKTLAPGTRISFRKDSK